MLSTIKTTTQSLFALVLSTVSVCAVSPDAYDARRELDRISDILTTYHIIPVFPFRQGLYPGEIHRYASKPESIYDTRQLEEMSIINVFELREFINVEPERMDGESQGDQTIQYYVPNPNYDPGNMLLPQFIPVSKSEAKLQPSFNDTVQQERLAREFGADIETITKVMRKTGSPEETESESDALLKLKNRGPISRREVTMVADIIEVGRIIHDEVLAPSRNRSVRSAALMEELYQAMSADLKQANLVLKESGIKVSQGVSFSPPSKPLTSEEIDELSLQISNLPALTGDPTKDSMVTAVAKLSGDQSIEAQVPHLRKIHSLTLQYQERASFYSAAESMITVVDADTSDTGYTALAEALSVEQRNGLVESALIVETQANDNQRKELNETLSELVEKDDIAAQKPHLKVIYDQVIEIKEAAFKGDSTDAEKILNLVQLKSDQQMLVEPTASLSKAQITNLQKAIAELTSPASKEMKVTLNQAVLGLAQETTLDEQLPYLRTIYETATKLKASLESAQQNLREAYAKWELGRETWLNEWVGPDDTRFGFQEEASDMPKSGFKELSKVQILTQFRNETERALEETLGESWEKGYTFEYVQFPSLELNRSSALSLGFNIPIKTSTGILNLFSQNDVRIVLAIDDAFSISYPPHRMLEILTMDNYPNQLGFTGYRDGEVMLSNDVTFLYANIKPELNTKIARIFSIEDDSHQDRIDYTTRKTSSELTAFQQWGRKFGVAQLAGEPTFIRIPSTVYYSRNFTITVQSDQFTSADGEFDFTNLLNADTGDFKLKFAGYDKKSGTLRLTANSYFPVAIGYCGELYQINFRDDINYRPFYHSEIVAIVEDFNETVDRYVQSKVLNEDEVRLVIDGKLKTEIFDVNNPASTPTRAQALDRQKILAWHDRINRETNKGFVLSEDYDPKYSETTDLDVLDEELIELKSVKYEDLFIVQDHPDKASAKEEVLRKLERIITSEAYENYVDYSGPLVLSLSAAKFEVPEELPMFYITPYTENTELPFNFTKTRFNQRRNPSGAYQR